VKVSSGRTWLVRGAVASAIVATLATVASLWLYVVNTRLGLTPNYLYGDAVAGLLYPAVGAYLVRRRPDNVVGWIFAATAPLGVTALANQYAVYALLGHPGELPLGELAAWIAAWGWAPALFIPTLLPLYFPDGTLPSPRWRPYVRVVLGVLAVLATAHRIGGAAPLPQLTTREREVLDLAAHGHDNATIARRLFLSEKTVRNNMSACLQKLQATSRAQAVARARDAGLGSGPTDA
jgi:DNA-binding CsgD family transcriptional regulator